MVTAVSSHSASVSALLQTASPMERMIRCINFLWGTLYGLTIGNVIKIWNLPRQLIGAVIRDLFFPLKCSWIANMRSVREQLAIEENFSREFWNPAAPLDPNYAEQRKVRAEFALRDDRIPIQLPEGRTVHMTCRFIESRNHTPGQAHYNFVCFPGIYTNISNNISSIYPYLAAYISEKEVVPTTPPGRYIIMSANNMTYLDDRGQQQDYKPASLDEAGFIVMKTLEHLRSTYGQIDQIAAHSLGCILLANALKQTSYPSANLTDRNIFYDRGPVSIWEISKKRFCGLGAGLFPLAWYSN